MLSIRVIQQFLLDCPPEQVDIVLELRNLVSEVAPGATEVIRARTRTLSYFFSADRGGPVSAGICGISLKEDHVRLFFPHGAFIPDPQGLLIGKGVAMRHLVLKSFEGYPGMLLRN